MKKYPSQYLTSELNVIDIYTDKGEKQYIFKRSISIQAKLIESVLREKDFELHFCLALGIQKARQTFFNEALRAAKTLESWFENNTAALSSIRKATKGLADAQNSRRIKLVTANAKADKMLEILTIMNQEVSGFRDEYLQ